MASSSNILVFKGDKKALTQQVISAGNLVVVDFHATWCPSCRKLSRVLPQIANEYPNVLFLKSDVDEAKDLSAEYQISSIPNIKFFNIDDEKNLIEIESIVGANADKIRDKLNELVEQ